MNHASHWPIRVLCGLIAAYHLIGGMAAVFLEETAVRIGGFLFGVNIALNGQTMLMLRYLGALALSFGVMMVFAAMDPVRNKKIIVGAVVYFLVRAFNRITMWSLLQEHTVGPAPNGLRIVVILLMAIGLLVFMPREKNASASSS